MSIKRKSYPSLCQLSLLSVLLLPSFSRLVLIAGSQQDADSNVVDSVEQAPNLRGPSDESSFMGGEQATTERKMKTLDELLAQAPRISVGQRHTAKFDCELNGSSLADTPGAARKWPPLVWLRLNRTDQGDDIKLISLDSALITADRRFRSQRLSGGRWQLTLENVQPGDSHAYFLCQVGGPSGCTGSSCPRRAFAGGALLTVLASPQIVVEQTSPSLVQAKELEPLSLRCKVASEPRSQVSWKLETLNGSSLSMDPSKSNAGYLHKFSSAHDGSHLENQLLSVVSSELMMSNFSRHQAGVYLCIASNGVQPGVSQRIRVEAVDCKSASGLPESCEQPKVRPPTTTTSSSKTPAQGARQQPVVGQQLKNGPQRRLWSTQSQVADKRGPKGQQTTADARSKATAGKALVAPLVTWRIISLLSWHQLHLAIH